MGFRRSLSGRSAVWAPPAAGCPRVRGSTRMWRWTWTPAAKSACWTWPAATQRRRWRKRTPSAEPSPRTSSDSCCGRAVSNSSGTPRARGAPIATSSSTRRRSVSAGGPSTTSTPRTSTPSTSRRRRPPRGRQRVAVKALQTIHLAHSPDSDDAFMFWALAAGKIDTGNRRYVHELADIESLNRRALEGELEITAVSFHAYAYLHERYALLPHGCSMGDGYGPRLVALSPLAGGARDALAGKLVAIPGERTTA